MNVLKRKALHRIVLNILFLFTLSFALSICSRAEALTTPITCVCGADKHENCNVLVHPAEGALLPSPFYGLYNDYLNFDTLLDSPQPAACADTTFTITWLNQNTLAVVDHRYGAINLINTQTGFDSSYATSLLVTNDFHTFTLLTAGSPKLYLLNYNVLSNPGVLLQSDFDGESFQSAKIVKKPATVLVMTYKNAKGQVTQRDYEIDPAALSIPQNVVNALVFPQDKDNLVHVYAYPKQAGPFLLTTAPRYAPDITMLSNNLVQLDGLGEDQNQSRFFRFDTKQLSPIFYNVASSCVLRDKKSSPGNLLFYICPNDAVNISHNVVVYFDSSQSHITVSDIFDPAKQVTAAWPSSFYQVNFKAGGVSIYDPYQKDKLHLFVPYNSLQ